MVSGLLGHAILLDSALIILGEDRTANLVWRSLHPLTLKV